MAKITNSKKRPVAKHITSYQPLYMIPILLLFLIYPFLVKYNLVTNPLTELTTYYSDPVLSDIFLYVKKGFLIFIGIAMVCVFLCDMLINSKTHGLRGKDYKVFIPLGVYALFVVLSSLFSENKDLAFGRMPGQFEPCGYCSCT